MVRAETDYFQFGPAQPGRPEKLASQTFVQVLQKDPSYSYVKLEDGRMGYVESEKIKPAPPMGRAVPFDPEPMEVVDVPLPDFLKVPEEIPVL